MKSRRGVMMKNESEGILKGAGSRMMNTNDPYKDINSGA